MKNQQNFGIKGQANGERKLRRFKQQKLKDIK